MKAKAVYIITVALFAAGILFFLKGMSVTCILFSSLSLQVVWIPDVPWTGRIVAGLNPQCHINWMRQLPSHNNTSSVPCWNLHWVAPPCDHFSCHIIMVFNEHWCQWWYESNNLEFKFQVISPSPFCIRAEIHTILYWKSQSKVSSWRYTQLNPEVKLETENLPSSLSPLKIENTGWVYWMCFDWWCLVIALPVKFRLVCEFQPRATCGL